MSLQSIREALEVRLNALSPALATAWENTPYTPVQGTAYQRTTLLPAPSRNPSMGSSTVLTREAGILQVSLFYPEGAGPAAAQARAELTRGHFPRRLTLTADGITVHITNTPYIHPAIQEPDWYHLPVSIPWRADVYT